MDNSNNQYASGTTPGTTPVQPDPNIPTVVSPVMPPVVPQTPIQPEPVNQPALDTNFSWPPATQPATQPSPIFPTIPPPLPEQTPPTYTDPNAAAANIAQAPSSLDNPYGAPVQPPPIDGGFQNLQTPPSTEPAWSPPAPVPTEQAPTDLSHLISSSEPNAQATIQPETIVMPQTNTPNVPIIQTESKGGIPRWVVGLGVGLLIIVAGASAYFILGIGQTPKNTSVPATEAPTTAPVATPASTPQEAPAATGSANFGQLEGSTSTPRASSAADILRVRQGQ